jgi:hypothetical protein
VRKLQTARQITDAQARVELRRSDKPSVAPLIYFHIGKTTRLLEGQTNTDIERI